MTDVRGVVSEAELVYAQGPFLSPSQQVEADQSKNTSSTAGRFSISLLYSSS